MNNDKLNMFKTSQRTGVVKVLRKEWNTTTGGY